MLNKLTVIDVETPSLHHDRICSIGVVRIEEGVIVSADSYLVDPECEFSPRNIRVHGIHPEDVWDSPTFPELWKRLEPFFYDGAVVAHNARFDLTVLAKTLWHYSLELKPLHYIDTCDLAYSFYPEATNCRLDTLCELLGLHLEHHKAGSDAEATARLMMDMFHRGLVIDQPPIFEYVPSEQRKMQQNKRSSSVTEGIRTLRSILHSITADGIVDDNECQLLYAWMRDHQDLFGHYPYDDIYVHLEKILEDGVAESDELDAMLELSEQVLDPLSAACETCRPDIQGMNIVLTGEFLRGERAFLWAELESQGAIIQNSVTRKTNLLLVGSLGNDLWVAKNYGTKVKRAMELQSQGFPIRIMKEEDFFAQGENNGTDEL